MTEDWRGTPIVVGSVVVFPTGGSNSAPTVTEGRVLKLGEKRENNGWGRWRQFVQIEILYKKTRYSWEKRTKQTTYNVDAVTVVSQRNTVIDPLTDEEIEEVISSWQDTALMND